MYESVKQNPNTQVEAQSDLTIAIPTYNRQHCLAELLPVLIFQSRAANATAVRVEIVISDNASTDSTREYVLDNFANDLRYFRNESNIGAAANFIECVSKASGRYIWIFGDDEILVEHAVERLLELLNKRPALVIAASSFRETRRYSDYADLLQNVLPLDPVFPVHHTLITTNVFPKANFNVSIAKERIATDYGLSYAILTSMREGDGIILLSQNDSLFNIRDVRAQFHWVPIRLDAKLICFCSYLSELTGIRKLRYNVWLYYRARRVYKLVHSKKLHRLLTFLRLRFKKL
jgi:glycosyltransferase involved in cell wall biosynthesis